jgi:hypothetical protein
VKKRRPPPQNRNAKTPAVKKQLRLPPSRKSRRKGSNSQTGRKENCGAAHSRRTLSHGANCSLFIAERNGFDGCSADHWVAAELEIAGSWANRYRCKNCAASPRGSCLMRRLSVFAAYCFSRQAVNRRIRLGAVAPRLPDHFAEAFHHAVLRIVFRFELPRQAREMRGFPPAG